MPSFIIFHPFHAIAVNFSNRSVKRYMGKDNNTPPFPHRNFFPRAPRPSHPRRQSRVPMTRRGARARRCRRGRSRASLAQAPRRAPLARAPRAPSRKRLRWAALGTAGARAACLAGVGRAGERGRPAAATPTCSTTRRRAMRSAGTPGRGSSLTTSTGASASRSSRSGSSSPRRTPRCAGAAAPASPPRCRRSGGRRGRCPAWRPPRLSHRAAPDEATLADAFAAATDAVSGALSAVFAGVSAASAESAASAAPSPRTPTPYTPFCAPASLMWHSGR